MGAASSIGVDAAASASCPAATGRGAGAAARRSVLRRLPQRSPEERRTGPGGCRSVRRRAQRAGDGEGRAEAARRHDAARRPAAPRQGDDGRVRRRTRERARPPRRGAAQSGPRRLAPSEPRGIRERHLRPARPRGERRRAAAERHGGLRLRQQRRRAVGHAVADDPLHRGGDQDQPHRRRQPRDPSDHPGLQGRVREPQPARQRGHAVCDARRPGRSPCVPARRRVRVPHPDEAERHGQHDRRDRRGRARHRAARRSRAPQAVHDRRQVQGARSRRADRGARGRQERPGAARLPHERGQRAGGPAAGEGRHPAGRRRLHRQRPVAGARPAARPIARRRRSELARHRHAVHLRAVQREDARGHAEPAAHLHVPSRGGARRRAVRAADHQHARQARLPPSGDRRRHRAAGRDLQGRARRARFRRGHRAGLEALLSSPKFLLRIEREPAGAARGVCVPDQRSRARLAAVLLPLAQHAGRRADRHRGARPAAGRSWISRSSGCSPIAAPRGS